MEGLVLDENIVKLKTVTASISRRRKLKYREKGKEQEKGWKNRIARK